MLVRNLERGDEREKEKEREGERERERERERKRRRERVREREREREGEREREREREGEREEFYLISSVEFSRVQSHSRIKIPPTPFGLHSRHFPLFPQKGGKPGSHAARQVCIQRLTYCR